MPNTSYSVLNVKPQSIKGTANKPAQRREVTLHDHHQTWLVNTNEVRDEVNRANSNEVANTLIYRDDTASFAANVVTMNSMVLNVPGGGGNPVTLNASGITIQSPAALTVNSGATFANSTVFSATSTTLFEGPLTSNANATFNGTATFNQSLNLSPSSQLNVNGPSFFNAPVTMTAGLTLGGDLNATGNSKFHGLVEMEDDLIVKGDLTVLGNNVTLEVSELAVEDKNIVVNKNDNYSGGSGIWFNRGLDEDAGFMQVSADEKKLELKAPLSYMLTVDMPNKDVLLRLDDDFASDQALMTTSNVSFRSVNVDTSFSKHVGLPSYSQENDAIASGKGWLSTPWVYTNAIESYANIHDANTSGVFVGSSPFADNHQIALTTFGESRLLVDRFGKVGLSTITPVEDVHLSREEPTLLLSTTNFDKKARLALSDLSEDYDSAGMHITFDANTGSGVVEVTPLALSTSLSLSVGGFEKTPEIEIKRNQVKIDTDLYVTQNGYVANEFAVDHTMFVRSHVVGVNVINPAHALDVSGNIHGDSDLLLTGIEPFAQIGTVTTLESMGRSGLVIEEETPVIQLATNSNSYRHGSQIYFNDAVHDSHWSMGTVLNGASFDFGRSNKPSTNTPEFGLDEYFGNTLMRFSDDDSLEFYLKGIQGTIASAITINTREANSSHLYLGELEHVNSTERDTISYSANTISSAIHWNGDIFASTVGEQAYFPNGHVDGEWGGFRFSKVDASINVADAPNAKVGVGQLYVDEKIGVGQTTPLGNLHITDSNAGIISETPGGNQKFSVTSDSVNGVKIKGEDVGGSNFTLQAQNPSQFELVSDNCSSLLRADGTADVLVFEMKDTDNNSHIKHLLGASEASLSVEHPTEITKLTKTTKFQNKVQFLDSSDQYIEETKNGSLLRRYKKDITAATISQETTTSNSSVALDLSPNKVQGVWETNTNAYSANIEIDGNLDKTSFTLSNQAMFAGIEQSLANSSFSLNNLNNDLVLKNLTDGNTEFSFSGTAFKFLHSDPMANTLYTAYCDHIDFNMDVGFESNVVIEGDFTSKRGIIFPEDNPDNKIEFNMTKDEGASNSNHPATSNFSDYIRWTCPAANTSDPNDFAEIYFASSGNLDIAFGDIGTTLPSRRLCVFVGSNGDEGVEIKSYGKHITYFHESGVYADVPIKQTHRGTLAEYEASNKWILKETGVLNGIYWNSDSGGTYHFSNHLDEYTNAAEDPDNQFVFVHQGNAKAAVDLDTGSFRTAGDVVADNDIIGFVTSDITYKENIKLLKNPLEMIDGIRGVNFDWKENPSGYVGKDIGVIAQEIEQIIPEAVRVGGNGQKQVNYEKIIPLLIECIKELKAKIGE